MDTEIIIITVPERAQAAIKLKKEIGECTILIDNEKRGIWYNAHKAWCAYTTKSHICVLQDDVEIVSDFMRHLENVISIFPNDILDLFNFRSPMSKKAIQNNEMWYSLNEASGQALCLPKVFAHEWITWCDQNTCSLKLPNEDDVRLSMYVTKYNKKIYHPVPGLANHTNIYKSTHGFCSTRVDKTFQKDIPFHTLTKIHHLNAHKKEFTSYLEEYR